MKIIRVVLAIALVAAAVVLFGEPSGATSERTDANCANGFVGLSYDADYEYRVQHLRDGNIFAGYQNTFHTRLAAGTDSPFTFVAYGDTRGPRDSVQPGPNHQLVVEAMLAKINELSAPPIPCASCSIAAMPCSTARKPRCSTSDSYHS